MIIKYAIFTFVVSVIPTMMIIKEVFNSYKVLDFICDNLPSLKLELISNNILSSGLFTFLFDDVIKSKNLQTTSEILFTKERLNRFKGNNGNNLYLAILGKVFDVSKASKYYGPGETYNAFTGRDGSRAFVTGDFTDEGLTDSVEDLTLQELRSLKDWLKFYEKEYVYKGKLIGRYYDENGKATGYNQKLQHKINEAERDEQDKNRSKLKFPSCNVEWTPEEGSRVWCSKRSGGIERDWVGVPRKLYEPGAEGYRCVCINTSNQPEVIAPETGRTRSGNLEEYEDCHSKSTSCFVYN